MYLTATNLLIIVSAGAVTGLLGALLGTGGGFFLIPVLVLGVGMPMHYAIATSIVTVIATSSAVASTNVERGTANMSLGMVLEVATAAGGITGGLTAGLLAPKTLEGLFALLLLPTAALMWRRRTQERPANVHEHPEPQAARLGVLDGCYFDEIRNTWVSYRIRRLWAGLGMSFLAGNLSGLLGIGGGIFKVPALHALCEIPMKAAAATSNFMIGVTAAASAFVYFGRGEVRPGVTAAAVLGILAGSAVGSILAPRFRGDALRRLFAVLLIIVAAEMGYRALGGGR